MQELSVRVWGALPMTDVDDSRDFLIAHMSRVLPESSLQIATAYQHTKVFLSIDLTYSNLYDTQLFIFESLSEKWRKHSA